MSACFVRTFGNSRTADPPVGWWAITRSYPFSFAITRSAASTSTPKRARRTSFAGTLIVVSAGMSDCFARASERSKMSWVSIGPRERLGRISPSASRTTHEFSMAVQRLFIRPTIRSQVGDMARTIKKGSVVVAVGTKKGGFLFHSSDRRKWSVAGPFMVGNLVYHMILDPRDGRTVYGAAPVWSEPWGPAVYRGRAGETMKPTQTAPKFKEGSDLAVTRIWHIEPGPADAPETIYAGVEPAALFRSDDRGGTWQDFEALNYHPTRREWQPGNGGLCLHSVHEHPGTAKHRVSGTSALA